MADTTSERQLLQSGAPPGAGSELRSVHTDSYPALLRQCGLSLLVSTEQAGKLIVLGPTANCCTVTAIPKCCSN